MTLLNSLKKLFSRKKTTSPVDNRLLSRRSMSYDLSTEEKEELKGMLQRAKDTLQKIRDERRQIPELANDPDLIKQEQPLIDLIKTLEEGINQ